MSSVKTLISKAKYTKHIHDLSIRALLCFLLVFVQGAGLVHSHEGELQKQFDCDICLKVGSNEDAITSSAQPFNFYVDATIYFEAMENIPFVATVPANSRAPPLV
ncbi:MAG: hypothetical protein GKR91_19230 [Pseudomonadales bacterium]|nr:hypothetical protein [Pseudomonadales bacterium]